MSDYEVDQLREYYLGELDKKDAEIERLRAALRFADAKLNGWLDDSREEEAREAVRAALAGKEGE